MDTNLKNKNPIWKIWIKFEKQRKRAIKEIRIYHLLKQDYRDKIFLSVEDSRNNGNALRLLSMSAYNSV